MTYKSPTHLASHIGLVIAGSAAYSMSTLFSAMKPVLLTRFVEQVSFSESLAGIIVAMPFVGIASAALVVKPVARILSTFTIFLLFGLLLILSELLSAYIFHNPGLVISTQFLGGLCVGILMGTTSQIIAVSSMPDQIFGIVDMTAVLLMSFMITAIGYAVGSSGLMGGYLISAAIATLFTLLLLVYRRGDDLDQQDKHPAEPLHITLRSVCVVVMGMLFVTSSGLGFAFMFSMAQNLGMDYETAGSQIGVLLLVSAAACLFGGWCSARFGPLRPLAIAFVSCAVGWYIAVNTSDSVVFIAALVPAIFSLQFNFPILLALSGSLDKSGQWAGIATPLLTSGFAWAAISAGFIVQNWGIKAIALATALGMFCCLGLLAVIARSAKK